MLVASRQPKVVVVEPGATTAGPWLSPGGQSDARTVSPVLMKTFVDVGALARPPARLAAKSTTEAGRQRDLRRARRAMASTTTAVTVERPDRMVPDGVERSDALGPTEGAAPRGAWV